MELIDLLNPEELFHPSLFYDGEWILGGDFTLDSIKNDYLLLNAKKINGKNAYQQYLDNTYYRPLASLLGSASLAKTFFPKIALTVDSSGQKREVHFDLVVFLYQHLLGIEDYQGACERFGNYVTQIDNKQDWISFIKEELKADRKKFYDVRNNGMKSSYYGNFYQTYLEYIRSSKEMMSLPAFLDARINGITKLLVASRYYLNFFSKEIPTETLLEAFDYNKFCLVAARSALDCCRDTEKIKHSVNNAVGYVRNYLDAVEQLRESNPQYDCSIIIDSSNKKTTIDELRKECEALLSRHPEFSFYETNTEQIETLLRKEGLSDESIQDFDISVRSNQELLSNLLRKFHEDRELAAEWEFIPKGTVSSSEVFSRGEGLFSGTSSLSDDEKIRRMLIGREYLENSDYAFKIYGINKFKGYVGYIYSNKNVIFEKYYEDVNAKKVASQSATYVMTLDNFVELSKLSKTEIIRIIKTYKSANIRRIYHRRDMDKWKSQIDQVTSGMDYNDAVMAYIDSLISSHDLKKSEVTK